MEIIRSYKTEIDPNDIQTEALLKHAGVARFAWNWALARRIELYKTKDGNERHANALKKTEFPWMYECSKCAPQEALKDLDQAYKDFFRRVKLGKIPAGFPKFKSKKNGIGGFRLIGSIHVTETHIKLPRLGWIRLKEHNYIPTKNIRILHVTITESSRRWFLSVTCKQEINILPETGESIGVDLGINKLAVISDGRIFSNPKIFKKSQKRLKRLQRKLSRRKKGGSNRKKTQIKITKLHIRITNTRYDLLHKTTSSIVSKTKPNNERPSVIAIEDLNVSGMTTNRHLSQAIHDVGFAEFRRQLGYKTNWYGSKLLVADRFFPSSRLCRFCGYINSELKLSDRKWNCNCGATLDRDLNAALNLKSLTVLVVRPEQTEKQTLAESNIRPVVFCTTGNLNEARTNHGIS